ncbi:MAG: thiamine phosphate synthase [Clostridiales Family XIII bacterium]|nr:thiamine phosphate synthase [Clostridiales Family XIII bacterium]
MKIREQLKSKNHVLYLVTDRLQYTDEAFYNKVEDALKAGIDILQLREKHIDGGRYLEIALKLRELTKRYNTIFIVDDRVDIAIAADADGVHTGLDDLPVAVVRRLVGPDKIVGATAKTVARALEAQANGADYLGIGAIYETTTKVKTIRTSVETLTAMKEAVDIPCYAIGGLFPHNMDILKGSNADGMCVVSAIMKAEDAYKATVELRQRIEEVL